MIYYGWGVDVGVFNWPVQISGMERDDWREIEATVDTGATYTVIPAGLLREMGVTVNRRDVFELADGRRLEMDMGRIWVTIHGKTEVTPVVFGQDGTAPLLGAMTLQILALAVDSLGERLVPRPSI